MWEHALGIRLCQCLPVGVCHLPLCLVPWFHARVKKEFEGVQEYCAEEYTWAQRGRR